MKSFRVIGLMSGTSLDGLDLVDVTFNLSEDESWNFQLNNTSLSLYDEEQVSRLKTAFKLPAQDLMKLSADLGRFYAKEVLSFLSDNEIDKSQIDFVASHGQTIFHQPQKGYTLQIGNGPELSVETDLPSVVDFRSKDVALGGNGAPLIPVADFLLFSNQADTFLNLGGFSNFSYKKKEKVFAYDICPVNIIINPLMQEVGLAYDENGNFGKDGEVQNELLNRLNDLQYYHQLGPKSLGWEWVEQKVYPLLNQEMSLKDKIRTLYEHIAFQIGKNLNEINSKSTLITGGGAKNQFLIERIRYYTNREIIVPNEAIIDYKEAIGFAFLGVLRWLGKVNVWSSVTGAKIDSSSGMIRTP